MLEILGMSYDFCGFQVDEQKKTDVYVCVERRSRRGEWLTNVESRGKGILGIIVFFPLNFCIRKKWEESKKNSSLT